MEICASFRPSCRAFGIVCIPHFPLSASSLSMSVRRFSGLMESSGSAEPSRELFEACRSGDLERVKKLVCPENVNSRDTAGRKSTPLHFAAGECDWGSYSILFILLSKIRFCFLFLTLYSINLFNVLYYDSMLFVSSSIISFITVQFVLHPKYNWICISLIINQLQKTKAS